MGSIFVSFMQIFFWEIFNIFFSIFVIIHTVWLEMVMIVFYRFLSFVWYVTWCFHYFIVNGCCFKLFYLWQILIFHISDRQADRQTDRQTDRQRKTERQTETERDREK